MHIRNPLEWLLARTDAASGIGGAAPAAYWAGQSSTLPLVRRITIADLGGALRAGLRDFAASRTDVAFLCLIYPVIGLFFAGLASREALLPMLFPLASGFALVGPLAALGLYEMSRRREFSGRINWLDVFGVLRAPSIGAICGIGLLLVALFLLWLGAARTIYDATLGPLPPASIRAFLTAVFTSGAGWAMIVLGLTVGAIFAATALAVGVVSLPLLLDRPIGLAAALGVSLRAVRLNPGPLALWGLIVAVSLLLGSLPLFIGLIVVLPVLGHATWHLYRALVRY